jgi:hypothetical protein
VTLFRRHWRAIAAFAAATIGGLAPLTLDDAKETIYSGAA